jgi:plasmid stabilization system protein ParE
MRVNWTDAAVSDLRSIHAYISQHSALYAKGMIDRIFAKTGLLADQPHLGAMVEEYDDESLRELLEHPYRIVYRLVDESRLDVVAVVHGARRLPSGL